MVRGLSRAVRGIAKHSRSKQKDQEEEEAEGWKALPAAGPRSFPLEVKELCWQKAEIVKGRDPSRWRRDPVGNLIFRKLVGCSGCLCYDYDHVLPYSKGGTSTLDNCQVMQVTTGILVQMMGLHLQLQIEPRETGRISPRQNWLRKAYIANCQEETWM